MISSERTIIKNDRKTKEHKRKLKGNKGNRRKTQGTDWGISGFILLAKLNDNFQLSSLGYGRIVLALSSTRQPLKNMTINKTNEQTAPYYVIQKTKRN